MSSVGIYFCLIETVVSFAMFNSYKQRDDGVDKAKLLVIPRERVVFSFWVRVLLPVLL